MLWGLPVSRTVCSSRGTSEGPSGALGPCTVPAHGRYAHACWRPAPSLSPSSGGGSPASSWFRGWFSSLFVMCFLYLYPRCGQRSFQMVPGSPWRPSGSRAVCVLITPRQQGHSCFCRLLFLLSRADRYSCLPRSFPASVPCAPQKMWGDSCAVCLLSSLLCFPLRCSETQCLCLVVSRVGTTSRFGDKS